MYSSMDNFTKNMPKMTPLKEINNGLHINKQRQSQKNVVFNKNNSELFGSCP